MQHFQPPPTPAPTLTGFARCATFTDHDQLWPTGDYFFRVQSAVEKLSKRSGKPMIEIALELYDESGARRRVFDHLTASAAWRTGDLCDALGLRDKYDLSSLAPEDLVGRTGRLRLDTRPPSGGYAARNVAAAYHPAAASRDDFAAA